MTRPNGTDSEGRTLAPLAVVAVAFACGILVGDALGRFETSPSIHLAGIAATAVAAMLVIRAVVNRMRNRRMPASLPGILSLMMAVAAGLWGELNLRQPAGSDIARATAALGRDDALELTVSGRVSSFVTADSSRARFDLDAMWIHGRDHVVPVTGQIRTTVRNGCGDLRRGMQVAVKGAVYRPGPAYNPADFDYAAFLERKGIASLAYVKKSELCVILDGHSDWVSDVRSWFRDSIRRVVPAAAQPLPTALIIGDRSGLDHETRTEFAESGLMHLLAISGLHVLFVGLSVYALLKSLLGRFRVGWRWREATSTAATLLLLTVYTLITGATPSVFRASVMAGVFLSSRPFFRVPNSTNSLGLAGLVVLMVDPDTLFTAGFQLSFSAVLGLITAGRTVSMWAGRASNGAARWCLGLLGASAVATLATAPVTISQFGYVPMAGLVLNLTAIPTASVLLVSSILSAVLAPVSHAVAANIGASVDLLTGVLNFQAGIGGASAGWTLIRPPPRLPWLAIPVAVMAALMPKIDVRSRIRFLFLALALPAVDLTIRAAAGVFVPKLDVVFFDVGHGDGALARLPNGRTILIDAGNRRKTWDFGERVIIPHLLHERIKRLDAVIVSHPHADHFGGLPSVLRKIPVGCVYDNGKEPDTHLYREYRRILAERIACHETLNTGDRIELDDYVSIDVHSPPHGYENEGENDESIVVKITFGATSFLFTGDVEHDGERILVANECDRLRSDVVKVAHHGSRTSSTEDFVRCTQAKLAVVSVGRPDEFGLPDEEILERWETYGSVVISIRDSGAVRMTSDGLRIERIR